MIRFPLHAGMRGGREVREDWHKVYVLIQAHLDNVAITDFSLRNDCVRLWSTAPRVAHFLADFAATQRWFSLMKNSSLIRRCMEQRVWWNGLVIKQIEGIGEALSKALEQGGIKSFADVLVADPRKLEALCGKHPPFGNDLQQKCSALPHYRLALNHNEETDVVQVVITQNNANTQRHGSAPAHHTMLLVGDTTLDAVRLLRSVGLRAGSGKSVTFDFQLQRGFSGEIVGCLMERHLLGIDTTVSITIGETRKETVGKAATKAAQQREGGGVTTSVSHSTAAATSLPSNQLTPAATEAEEKTTALTTNLELTQGEEVTNTNGFQPLVGDDQMDEEYERLIEMKSNIVSKWNSGISGTDPKGRGKRDRRGECISLTGAAQLGREEEAMEQIESFSFRGREVTLPRVSSPVPLPVTCDKQNAQQPSERFRFGLQGIVPSMLVRDRAPNRTFGPCAAASGCGDRTVFSTGPVSPALPYHYLCGGGVPPYQPQPPHWSRQSPTPWDARVAHFDRLQQPHATGTGDLLVSEGEGFFASSHPASEARARRVAWGSQEESFAPWAHLHHTMPQPAGTPIPNSRVRNGYAHQWNPSTYHAGSNAHYGRAAIRHTVVRKGWW
uniref:Uncharacterized protein TCIL3000_11_14890 n=1 Tax=Trypanosoma congolense (strain IL3000) TaxID=1068625 RepID=G0V2U9_TRYCI|nr:unnamed protein product [Trypanosoma congolense IL3000]